MQKKVVFLSRLTAISRTLWSNFPQACCFCCYVLCCCGLLFACKGSDTDDLEEVFLEDKVGIERATGVRLLYSDSAIVRVIVTAPTLLRHIAQDTPKQEFVHGLEADFFNESHQQTSKLVAGYGEQFEQDRKVYLRDSVQIWNTKNETLLTDELIWDEPAKEIYSTKYVKITTPTQIIEGYGFRSNLEFTDWEIYQVSGIIEQKNMVEQPF